MNVPGKHRISSSHNEPVNGFTTSKATHSQTTLMPEPQVQLGKTERGEGLAQPRAPGTRHAAPAHDS